MEALTTPKDGLRADVRNSLSGVNGVIPRARHLYLDRPSFALADKHQSEFSIKSQVAERYKIAFRSVVFTGSSQLGFSPVKDTLFEVGRSDLDIACIDSQLYMRFWESAAKASSAFSDQSKFGSPENLTRFKDQISRRAMILIDFMPKCAMKSSERAFQDELSRNNRRYFGRVSIAIYMNEYAFCWKQASAINALMGYSMQNDLRYRVTSREIGDLLSGLKAGTLIISPYFQRNLVWRDTHKREFIETILEGYPFPQIFLARGPIDLETMRAFTCVVDGQQRLNAIREFAAGNIEVNGRKFSQLSSDEKTEFVKYEVPVIDFDLDVGDARLKDVFKRLNRTFYSLSAIERMATEFSSSEYMLIARLLSDDIPVDAEADQEASEGIDEADESADAVDGHAIEVFENAFLRDPGITEEKWQWLVERARGAFPVLLSNSNVFTPYEFQRKVPLMFVLNIMTTILSGYYNRNVRVKSYLEDFSDEFDASEEVVFGLNSVAEVILSIDLPAGSIWWNKANFFTMVVEIFSAVAQKLDVSKTREKLLDFEKSIPSDYALAAREAVNNKTQREIRARYVGELLTYQAV